MTEASYLQAKKVMRKASYIRGKITAQEKIIAKWTNVEGVYREQLKPGRAEGAKKILEQEIEKLAEYRRLFKQLQFPPNNLGYPRRTKKKCFTCGKLINRGTYCDSCKKTNGIVKKGI